jgi:hypothetical protein
MRIDSRPCADDHSSPRSPRHVLCQLANQTKTAPIKGHLPKYRQTDLPSSVDIGVEASAAAIGGDGCDAWSLCGVLFGELDGEFKEAKLVRCVGRTNNQRPNMAYVDVTAGNCNGEIRALLDLAQLTRDTEDGLVRHLIMP